MSGWASNNVRPKLWYNFDINNGSVCIDLYSIEAIQEIDSQSGKTTIYLDNGGSFLVNETKPNVQIVLDDIS